MAQPKKSYSSTSSAGSKFLIVIVAFALVGGIYAAWKSLAARPPLATVEAETMVASTTDGKTPSGTVVTDSSSSGGRVFQYAHNGVLSQTFTLASKSNVVKVYVRDSSVSTNTKKRSPCSVPSLVQAYVDGHALTHQFRVVNTNWKVRGQMVGRNVPAGSHNLQVFYQHDQADPTCAPQLMIDKVDFFFQPSLPSSPKYPEVSVVEPHYVDPMPAGNGDATGYDDGSPYTQSGASPSVIPDDQNYMPADPGVYTDPNSSPCHPGYQCIN